MIAMHHVMEVRSRHQPLFLPVRYQLESATALPCPSFWPCPPGSSWVAWWSGFSSRELGARPTSVAVPHLLYPPLHRSLPVSTKEGLCDAGPFRLCNRFLRPKGPRRWKTFVFQCWGHCLSYTKISQTKCHEQFDTVFC